MVNNERILNLQQKEDTLFQYVWLRESARKKPIQFRAAKST